MPFNDKKQEEKKEGKVSGWNVRAGGHARASVSKCAPVYLSVRVCVSKRASEAV